MTTSATQLISAKSNDAAFTPRELAVFEGYAQNAAHSAVLTALEELRKAGPVSQAAIARKLGVSPSQVTRWLSSPGNYEIKTLGYLLGAMGYVPEIRPAEIASLTRGNNFVHEAADFSPTVTNPPGVQVTLVARTTAPQTQKLEMAF